jgi:hypothetical protein
VLGPDGRQRAKTARSLDVADDTDNLERRGLDDRDGLDDLTLVHFCLESLVSILLVQYRYDIFFLLDPGRSKSLNKKKCEPLFVQKNSLEICIPDDVGHASLEAKVGSEVNRLLGVIPREGLDLNRGPVSLDNHERKN